MLSTDLCVAIEGIAWNVAREVFGATPTRPAALARQVEELSRRYTTDRTGPRPDVDPRHAPARLLFFTMADLPKLGYPIAELATRHRIPPAALRFLDLGAGFGAQTLAAAALFDPPGTEAGRTLEVDAVDIDPLALDTLSRLLAECRTTLRLGTRTRLRTVVRDLQRPLDLTGPYDLVVAGNLLNELDPSRRLPLLCHLLGLLSPAGHLIVLEPALRHTSRDLHALRDQLAATDAAAIVAPCTRRGPCPALERADDWCHERRAWQPPPALAALARATRLRQGDLLWSYLTLGPPAVPVAEEEVWRVVGGPIRSKGKRELFLCGPAGRRRAMRLDRHRSSHNQPFEALERGCMARFDGGNSDGTLLRIGSETRVTLEDPTLGITAPPRAPLAPGPRSS